MYVVDVSDPSNPSVVGSIFDSTNLRRPGSLAVEGNYVYVGSLSR